jgi:DNA-directed RNA polymerase alpha subunit
MTKITDLPFSVRAKNCLRENGFTTLDQVIRATNKRLLGCRNLGLTTLSEIRFVQRKHSQDPDGKRDFTDLVNEMAEISIRLKQISAEIMKRQAEDADIIAMRRPNDNPRLR